MYIFITHIYKYNTYMHVYIYEKYVVYMLNIFIYNISYMNIQSWSELLAPLVNMIKKGSEKKPALLILLIFYLFF